MREFSGRHPLRYFHRNFMIIGGAAAVVLGMLCILHLTAMPTVAGPASPLEWSEVPHFNLRGGLEAFWDVHDKAEGENERNAYERGFQPVTLLNTYSDYIGLGKEDIHTVLKTSNRDPWSKPHFFERVIRRNIANRGSSGTFVHDIEFDFEEDARKAFAEAGVRAASGAKSFDEFEESYFREWASWFTRPLTWTKEIHPGVRVGLYGPQAFNRDYWGVAGKSAAQIDGKHRADDHLWRFIDPYVDFYVASVYVFYNRPDSIFYIAANVEENAQRARGGRPVYAYEWMRYHTSNRWEGNREIDPYLVEAMAVVPYFSGAKAIVLWGAEPQLKPGAGRPYQQLPLFAATLKRIAGLSDKIGRGRLVIDAAAHELWGARKPLVRRVEVGEGDCVVMAINPWQGENEVSSTDVRCGGRLVPLEMKGRRVTLADISRDSVMLH